MEDQKTKYNVFLRREGTLIGVVWAWSPEDALVEVSTMYDIAAELLVTRVSANQKPSAHTSIPFHIKLG